MASDDVAPGVDQNWYNETECFEAARDLLDLAATVSPWILRIDFQFRDKSINHPQQLV
jgi:hypothetical protein